MSTDWGGVLKAAFGAVVLNMRSSAFWVILCFTSSSFGGILSSLRGELCGGILIRQESGGLYCPALIPAGIQ